MLRTRAPLSNTCIATHVTPFDLHVLNTPPAFVLSQNQTLRKKRMVSCRCRLSPSFETFARHLHVTRSARLPRRAAHNSIFFLFPASLPFCSCRLDLHPAAGSVLAGPHCQRTSSRGLKSRSGVVCRDRHPVSRPPIVVAAREASTPSAPPSTHFENFFQIFENEVNRGVGYVFLGRLRMTENPPFAGNSATEVPPQASMAERTMASPSPLPPVSRLRERSSR